MHGGRNLDLSLTQSKLVALNSSYFYCRKDDEKQSTQDTITDMLDLIITNQLIGWHEMHIINSNENEIQNYILNLIT